MKIKDIPFPALRDLAMKQQALQGNKRDESIDIESISRLGGFNWEATEQGSEFWRHISNENYYEAIPLYNWDFPPNEIKEKTFNEQKFLDKIAFRAMELAIQHGANAKASDIANFAYSLAKNMLKERSKR